MKKITLPDGKVCLLKPATLLKVTLLHDVILVFLLLTLNK